MRNIVLFAVLSASVLTVTGCRQPDRQRTDATVSESPPRRAEEPPRAPDNPRLEPPASEDTTASQLPLNDTRGVFPHVRINTASKHVEFDARVVVRAEDAESPVTYLEVLACIPDTREHESLLTTPAIPSHIHAALLLIGLAPGKPGEWKWEQQTLIPIPPEGNRVSVEVVYVHEGREVEARITDWVMNASTGATLTQTARELGDGFVFAGSLMIARRGVNVYDADGAGTVIGLTAFGNETIAWSRMYNPDSSVEEPVWIARRGVIPAAGTAVKVRVSRMAP